MSAEPYPLTNDKIVTKLDPTAYKTTGSGSALQIQPKRTIRTVRVEINSIDRDYSKYSKSNSFRWHFPFPVKEIREMRLIGGTIPVPLLNIDELWSSFIFSEFNVPYTIKIPKGYYTLPRLLKAIECAINSSGVKIQYKIDQVANTQQIRIRSYDLNHNMYCLQFGTGKIRDRMDPKTGALLEMNTPARILGFGFADYRAGCDGIIAPRLPHLWYGLERTYLYFSFDSTIDMRNVLRGTGRKEPTAVFYNDELNIYNTPRAEGGEAFLYPLTKYLNKETYDSVLNPGPAPISRVSYIDVELRDEFYRLINTQGREMSLLLDITIAD